MMTCEEYDEEREEEGGGGGRSGLRREENKNPTLDVGKKALYFSRPKICNLCTLPFDIAHLMRIPVPKCVYGILR